jgi:hypothetical protein
MRDGRIRRGFLVLRPTFYFDLMMMSRIISIPEPDDVKNR